jgi:hypothetical protein
MMSATDGLYWGFHNIQYRRHGLSRLLFGSFSEDLFFKAVKSRTPILEGKFFSKKVRLIHAQTRKIIFYDCNIKYHGEIIRTKTRSKKCRKNFACLLMKSKFRKAVQMCVPPYIQAGHGTQLSKSVLSRQNWDVWDPYLKLSQKKHIFS